MIEQETKPLSQEQKDEAVTQAISDIRKEHGKGAVFSMADRVGTPVPSIPTGIYSLDHYVIGCGGMPRGRIVELIGPEGSGKSTIALCTVASAQAAGGRAAFVDVEHALSPDWMVKNDVNVDDLLISQPDYGEQALQIVETLLLSRAFDIIVVDSIAALVPRAEFEGELGDANVGLQARMMSQACRKLTGLVAKANAVLLFTNQIRATIGNSYGPSETTPGGRAMRFYASLRLDVRRKTTNKIGEEATSNTVKIKAIKNRMASPYRECEVDIAFGYGFDKVGDLINVAVDADVIKKSGSWYSWNDNRLGQGKEQAKEFLVSNKLLDTLKLCILEKINATKQ